MAVKHTIRDATYVQSWSRISKKTQRKHVVIAEYVLGRELKNGEEVHHIDGNKRNNCKNNLVICENRSYHLLLHYRQDALNATGDPNSKRCGICKEWGSAHQLSQIHRGGVPKTWFYHKECAKIRSRASANRLREAQGSTFGRK
jgi:hypothetical protein